MAAQQHEEPVQFSMEKFQAALEFNKKVESRLSPEEFTKFLAILQEFKPKAPAQAVGDKGWEEFYNQIKDSPDIKDQLKKAFTGPNQSDTVTGGNEENERATIYDRLKTMLKNEPDLAQELEQFIPIA